MTTANGELQGMPSTVLTDGDGDFLRGVLVRARPQVTAAEVSTVCNAGCGERKDVRWSSRNGHRARPPETRVGTPDLAAPKLRCGRYLPSRLEPRRRRERVFVNVLSEACVLGVSTRLGEEPVKAMGANGIGRSKVSRMVGVLDEQVRAFHTHPPGD